MAHFAKIENNIVTDVVALDDEHELDGNLYLNQIGLIGEWVKTSYNDLGNFAGIGDVFDPVTNQFQPKQPHNSWLWNKSTRVYDPPAKHPLDGKPYYWNEAELAWVEITPIEEPNV